MCISTVISMHIIVTQGNRESSQKGVLCTEVCLCAKIHVASGHNFNRRLSRADMSAPVLLPFQSAVIASVITAALSAGILIIVGGTGILAYYLIYGQKKNNLSYPPYSNASMIENINATQRQKTLFILDRDRDFFSAIDSKSLGGSPFGAVFRMYVPTWNFIMFTSDYVLAKLILAGDTKAGIKECEKSSMMKVMNFVDRDSYNLVTNRTDNDERENTRKAIALSFSTTNLTKTWPFIKGVIFEQFEVFRRMSATGEVFDVKNTIGMFFLRTLSRGFFGVEFTIDGTESEDTINGIEFLNCMELATRESARRLLNPFRQLMFWDEEYKKDAVACKIIRASSEKVLRLQRAKEAARAHLPEAERKPFTILDHINQHTYKDDNNRLSDISIFVFAGMDTTAVTFCFMLMELSRNLPVKAKLQRELAFFMPENRTHESIIHNSSFNDRMLLSAIAGCEYLNWCVKEILRLWPAGAGGPIRDIEQDIEYNGMLLPKGSKIASNFYAMFRERWIDQPDVYLPERWSDSNPQLPQLKEMLMPFSLGRRSCVGQNMAMFQLKVVAAHFLHYFDFELVGEPTFEFFITLKPDDIKMRVRQRV